MKDMAKHIITVISDFWVSKFAQYTIQKIGPAVARRPPGRPRALISLHWIIGFGLNVSLNSEEIRQTTFNIKS